MGDPVAAGSPRGVEPLGLEEIVPELVHPVEFLVLHRWWTTFDCAAVAVARRPLPSVCDTAPASAPRSAGGRAFGQLAANIGLLRWAERIIETVSGIGGLDAAWRIRVEEI
ncbi:MAG: hypothetical protein IPG45_18110 [Deltaproteobacteria bacterium]|nr:hypothetical protein [Deltaproteobacteria bacterium]